MTEPTDEELEFQLESAVYHRRAMREHLGETGGIAAFEKASAQEAKARIAIMERFADLRRQVAACQEQRNALLGVVKAVEWVPSHAMPMHYCPWCYGFEPNPYSLCQHLDHSSGHSASCPRQTALAKQEAAGPAFVTEINGTPTGDY